MSVLGQQVPVPDTPNVNILETFLYITEEIITFETNEFTSLCPKTGQPDFATVIISYKPYKVCLESKSLKLYLQSYRNTGAFIEELVSKIYTDLYQTLNPD